LLNAVHYTGATPILADIHSDSCNIDAADVKKRINERTRAVIVPHLFGLAADLDQLLDLDVPLIEDCAHAVGTEYKERAVGTFGLAAIYSFYATKVITTGEGGMVVSSSRALIDRIRDLKSYDRKRDYRVRYNYKMNDMQAAMGLSQLGRLDAIIRLRRAIAEQYAQAFENLDLDLPPDDPGHIYFRYVIGLNADPSPWIERLAGYGVGSDRPIFLPLHRQLQQQEFPRSEKAWNSSLSIPIYPSLSDHAVARVIQAIQSIASKNN
jgi:dTDP-4-amino-4,6-dideoxygalactose transaminase